MKKLVLALMLSAMTVGAVVIPLVAPAEACSGKKKGKVKKKQTAAIT